MKEATLIFPDQLFENHPALDRKRVVYLVEEFLYFRIQSFHKQRLILLRAAMQAFGAFLREKGYQVVYIESKNLKKRGALAPILMKEGVGKIHLCTFADDWLRKELQGDLVFYPSPNAICSEKEFADLFQGKQHYSMASFYAYQRKKLNILMENGAPIGGKYSFDQENRCRIPKGLKIPPLMPLKPNAYVQEAIDYVEREFPQSIGEAAPFLYPVTFSEAKKALADFIKKKLPLFGAYEDAILKDESFLFHSVLSPLLNIGLLTPRAVIDAALAAKDIPLNSLEGFIRQILGWREFMRGCYLLKGKEMRTTNQFHHKREIPKGFWEGTTGILPIDCTIQRVLKTGYCHHIERLMVLGNFLLLCETDPNAVYEWFMAFFVDAYDWVMVPNVYSMSQYAEGGLITTKPYISGAHYLLKMSDYPKGEWVDIWDGLYWRFVQKHRTLFERNPRTKVLLGSLTKNKAQLAIKMEIAEQYLSVKLN